MMKPATLALALLALTALTDRSAAAAGPAPAGSIGTITVDYRFESSGRKAGKDESVEWKIERELSLRAEVSAGKPMTRATLVAPDAAELAAQTNRNARVAQSVQQMQPMMQAAEKIAALCGDSEACLTRETQKLGFGMSAGQLEQAQSAGRQAKAAAEEPAPQVQLWQPKTQSGRYRIAEELKRETADPICPGLRCRRQEQRRGDGAVPDSPAGKRTIAMAEIDHAKQTLTLVLPVWMNALPIDETVNADGPGAKDNGTRKTASVWRLTDSKPFTVPLAATGEQVREFADASGFNGKLSVRWRFDAR